MLLTEHTANHSINITLHVTILFTFLTIFFFTYISKVEESGIKDSINKMVSEQTETILDNLDSLLLKLEKKEIIDWKSVDKMATDMINNSQGKLKKIEDNNKQVLWTSIGIVIFLNLMLVGLFVFYKYKKFNISVKEILLENAVIFTFIGIIEVLFFVFIAGKYIPVTPDFVVKSVLDRVKYRVTEKLQEK